MATVDNHIHQDPALLLERAAAGLFPLTPSSATQPWPTLPAWIVLRQGGLRDDFHRLAASQGVAGWFDPPVCVFGELAQRWSGDGRVALSGEERAALLSTLLARHGGGVFDRSGSVEPWVPAVDRFIGELVSESITPAAIAAAFAQQSGRDAFEQQRDAVLALTYAKWTEALVELDRADGRDALARLAAFIDREPEAFAARLGHRRDIRIVGLADVRGGWRALLAALERSTVVDHVTLLTSHALSAHALSAHASNDTPVREEPLAHDAHHALTLLEAPDAAREIELIAVRIRALIDAGVTPSCIAVVSREARPHVDQFAEALERLGVPVTARRRTALAHTGPARAIRALLEAAASGWSRHAVVELAEQPLLALGVDAEVVNFIGRASPTASVSGWEEAMTSLETRCALRDRAGEEADYRRPLPDTDRVTRSAAAWKAWKADAQSLDGERSAADWFAWMIDVLSDARWHIASALASAPAGEMRVWRADVLARDRLLALAEAWRSALATFDASDATIDAAAFAQRLTLALDEDLIAQPESSFGVVVAEALAAGWRAFDHLFIVGMSAGAFPRRLPPSPVFGARERSAVRAAGIAIEPPDQWRQREEELFRVLCAAPRERLTISWPAMDADGREVARSAFVDDAITAAMQAASVTDEAALQTSGVMTRVAAEEVVTDGYPVLARDCADSALAQARRVSAIEAMRSRDGTPWNGVIEDAALVARVAAKYGEGYPWSATQLETLAKCPWGWFAARLLRLEQQAEPDDSLEPSVRGIVMHDALDRFFAAARTGVGGPVHLLEADRPWAVPALDAALDAAWSAAGGAHWLGAPSLRATALEELRHQLRTYLDFELGQNAKAYNNRSPVSKQIRMGADEGEFEFTGVELEGNAIRFRLRGQIDRIDRGVDDRIDDAGMYYSAIDYKSSKGSTPANGKKAGWDDGVVLQVPLYAAVLRKLRPEQTLARLEYRTLRAPATVHQLDFSPLVKAGAEMAVQGNPEAEEKLAHALDVAGSHIAAVRDGIVPTAPKDSTGCSPYCPARDICRIPGGPVEGAR
jgi:hypothetical protein